MRALICTLLAVLVFTTPAGADRDGCHFGYTYRASSRYQAEFQAAQRDVERSYPFQRGARGI